MKLCFLDIDAHDAKADIKATKEMYQKILERGGV